MGKLNQRILFSHPKSSPTMAAFTNDFLELYCSSTKFCSIFCIFLMDQRRSTLFGQASDLAFRRRRGSAIDGEFGAGFFSAAVRETCG